MGVIREALACRILAQAIVEQRCSEFIECIMNGGSATVDSKTGELVLVSGDALADLVARSSD